VLATALSAAWGGLSALTAWGLSPQLGLAAEVARNGAWLALLLHILRLRLPPGSSLPAPLRAIRVLGGLLVGGLLLVGVFPSIVASQPALTHGPAIWDWCCSP
jgi:hypothetical protein